MQVLKTLEELMLCVSISMLILFKTFVLLLTIEILLFSACNKELFVSVTPSPVSIKSIHRHNVSCVKIIWYREQVGKCALKYHLKFDGNGEIYHTSDTYFTMCTLPNITNVSIWATHKTDIGNITVSTLSLVTPAPDAVTKRSIKTTVVEQKHVTRGI